MLSALTDLTILGIVFSTFLISRPTQKTFAFPNDAKMPATLAPIVPVAPMTVTVLTVRLAMIQTSLPSDVFISLAGTPT